MSLINKNALEYIINYIEYYHVTCACYMRDIGLYWNMLTVI